MTETKVTDSKKRSVWFGSATRLLVSVLTAALFTSCVGTQRESHAGGMSREDNKALQRAVDKDAAQLKEQLNLSTNQEFQIRTALEGMYRKAGAMAGGWQANRRIDLAKSREEIDRIQRIAEEQIQMTLTPKQKDLYTSSREARTDHLLEYALNAVLQSSPPGGMPGMEGPRGGGTGGQGGFPGMGSPPGMGRGGW